MMGLLRINRTYSGQTLGLHFVFTLLAFLFIFFQFENTSLAENARGGKQFRLGVELGGGLDTNPIPLIDEKATYYNSLATQIGFKQSKRNNLTYADYYLTFLHYLDRSSLNQTFHRLALFHRSTLNPKTKVTFKDTFQPTPVELTRPHLSPENLTQVNTIRLELEHDMISTKRKEAGFLFGLNRTDYLKTGQDNTQIDVRGRFNKRANAYLDFSLNAGSGYRSNAGANNLWLGELAGGVKARLSPRMRLDANTGVQILSYQQQSITKGVLFDVGLNYRISRHDSLELRTSQRLSTDLEGNPYKETKLGFTVQSKIRENVKVEIELGLLLLTSGEEGAEDNLQIIDMSVEYQHRDYLTAKTMYRYNSNGGKTSSNDFTDHQIIWSLGYRFY